MNETCRKFQQNIREFLMGGVICEEFSQLQNHLCNCSDCYDYFQSLRDIYYGKKVPENPEADSRTSGGRFAG